MPQIWHPRITVFADLYGKPQVLAMARDLGAPWTEVVGALVRVWLKFQAEATTEGVLAGRDAKWVDAHVGRVGFAAAMAAVGWLEVGDRQLRVPEFDVFISKKAVRRTEHAARVAGAREGLSSGRAGVTESKASQQRTTAHKRAHADVVIPPVPVVPAGGSSAGFEAFWGAYPRKVKKQDARRAFEKVAPPPELLTQMLAAVARQSASDEWRKDGGRYIPHPTTWLNGRRWEDEGGRGPGGGLGGRGRVVGAPGKYGSVGVVVANDAPADPPGAAADKPGQPSLFPEAEGDG